MARFLRRLKQRPQNILVARTDRIGDFVLTLPVFEALKTVYKLDFTVLCQGAVKPLLENNPFVGATITVKSDTVALVDEIRRHNFDCLLVLVNDPLMRKLISKLGFIPVRIGPLSRPSVLFKYSHPVIQKRSRSVLNEAEYNLELLEIFGKTDTPFPRPKLYFTDGEIEQAQSVLTAKLDLAALPQQFAIMHQGMGGSALNWEDNQYRAFLEKALKHGFVVFLTGSSDGELQQNQQLVKEYKTAFPQQIFDLSGQMTLREFAALIKLAFVFVGPSTGPTHLANAVETEIITFYPPIQVQSAKRWGPFKAKANIFSPDVECGQKYKCIKEKCPHFYCMNKITVEDVFSTFLGIAERHQIKPVNLVK
jgi:ADP-heptose:LPS heptosyltransferase